MKMSNLISCAITLIFGALVATRISSACSIPGGMQCESILPLCHQTPTTVWEGLCCGTQEIQDTCCAFYCYKVNCNGTELCGRILLGTYPGSNCVPSPTNPNNRICD